jgi:hypothetical protein
MNSDCDASASGQLTPTQWKLLMLFGSFSPRRLGWRSPCCFLRESYSGLRDGIAGYVRSRSSCYRWRTHHFKTCRHQARSHQCPRQEDRREQAYDGDETSVAWTLAAASGRLFISVHDPHSIKIFEGQHFRNFQAPTAIHSCIDPCQFHLKNCISCPACSSSMRIARSAPDERTSRDAARARNGVQSTSEC